MMYKIYYSCVIANLYSVLKYMLSERLPCISSFNICDNLFIF